MTGSHAPPRRRPAASPSERTVIFRQPGSCQAAGTPLRAGQAAGGGGRGMVTSGSEARLGPARREGDFQTPSSSFTAGLLQSVAGR
ncbi:hypothetical protein AAFF_G00122140 [Aldrovandia affinis]|uniref:Uncharacterized protein n=1 Tax=Aldrovandia affinis TaxID=143900 RepID=A0AAD7RRR8_9TELE|nr:hypothetical protein AAFF_G00122140 [Aldrovandia affinis]